MSANTRSHLHGVHTRSRLVENVEDFGKVYISMSITTYS